MDRDTTSTSCISGGDGASVAAGNEVTSELGEGRSWRRGIGRHLSSTLSSPQLCSLFSTCCHLWFLVFGDRGILEMTLVSDCCVLIHWVFVVWLLLIFTCKKVGRATEKLFLTVIAMQKVWCCHSEEEWLSMQLPNRGVIRATLVDKTTDGFFWHRR